MDRTRFSGSAPGDLVEITLPSGGKDVSFVPASLPPSNWQLSSDLIPLLIQAHEELARLDGVGRHLEDPKLLLSPLQGSESIKSSSLEGTYATPQELLLFELNQADSKGDEARPWREVFNYRQALNLGTDYLEHGGLSLTLIRMLHERLLSGVRGESKAPGRFRDRQVFVGASRRFVPPPPEHLSSCLSSLESTLSAREGELNPLVYCFLVHYQFECIHPFRDGNGRVGRLLLALMVWKTCSLSLPWLYMSPFFERNRDEYIDRLFAISAKGDWDPWIEFCLLGVIEESKLSFSKCEQLLSLRKELHQLTQVKPRLAAIVDMLFRNPFCTASELVESLGISLPTAHKDLRRLQELEVVDLLNPSEKQHVYYAPSIFNIAYGES